jgi:uncharacterized Ntn-hydrolase superfamily protein
MVSRHGDLVCSQAYTNRRLGALGARCLSDGMTVEQTIARMKNEDENFGFRQIGVVTKAGRAAAHTGADCRDWKGDITGDGFLVMGNVLAGAHVIEAMAATYGKTLDEPLEERLMQALEAGRDAGGQGVDGRHMTERSAGLAVYGWDADGFPELSEIDVRIDAHPTAVAELRRQYEMIRRLMVYLHMMADDPAALPSTETWEGDHLTAASPPALYD